MMSTCVSQRGEFSSHEPDDNYTCQYCGVFDEEAVLAVLQRYRDRLDELEAHPAMLVDPGAEARGYDQAVINLRDDDAYERWCRQRGCSPLSAADRAEFADYAKDMKETT